MGPCSCGIKLSRTLKEKFRCQLLSCVWLLTTSWTVRLLCPWNYPSKNTGVFFSRGSSPGDLPHPGIKPGSPAFEADSLLSQLPRKLTHTHTHTHTHTQRETRKERPSMGELRILIQSKVPGSDLSHGLLAKTLHSQCRGPSSIPSQRTRSHMSQLKDSATKTQDPWCHT